MCGWRKGWGGSDCNRLEEGGSPREGRGSSEGFEGLEGLFKEPSCSGSRSGDFLKWGGRNGTFKEGWVVFGMLGGVSRAFGLGRRIFLKWGSPKYFGVL
jgi:hypothetical protein